MLVAVLVAAAAAGVRGHGGMVWPPVWQAGPHTDPFTITSTNVYTEPATIDPVTGHEAPHRP